MTHAASRHIAIWIDSHQAFLFRFGTERSEGWLAPTTDGGWSQYRVDVRRYSVAQQYYDAVLTRLEPRDEILILGPDQARDELRQNIECHGGSKGSVVGLCHASKLAEADLVFLTSGIGHGGRRPGPDSRILQQGSSIDRDSSA